MAYEAKVLADSISDAGVRLTTLSVTFPRIVLAEFNTHRVFSRSSASSRAIPVEKRIAAVAADPFIPESFGKNKKGMQADEALAEDEADQARQRWHLACHDAVFHARELAILGVHKQLANRLIEPFCWHTVIVTATEWENFFALRDNEQAQPEIAKPARLMRAAMEESEPSYVVPGKQWHRPLMPDEFQLVNEGYTVDQLNRISIARCARVSYLTHDGKRDPKADLELCDRLEKSGHMSPFEHVATPLYNPRFRGNFFGWLQYRKTIINEDNFGALT